MQTSHPDDAAFAAAQAKAAVARLGDDVGLEVELGHALAWMQDFAGDYPEELRTAQGVMKLAEANPGAPQAMELALETLGSAQLVSGHKAEALETERRRLAQAIAIYGPEHPQVAFIADNLADAEAQNGFSAAARDHLVSAIALEEKLYGKDSSYALLSYLHLAFNRLNAGDPAEALEAAEHAARIQSGRPLTAGAANIHFLAAAALQALGRIDEARRRFEESLAVVRQFRTASGSSQEAQIANALADLLIDAGKLREARALVEPERAAAEAALRDGTATGYTAETFYELGRLAAAQGRLAEARSLIERELPLERDNGADTSESLTHELALAELELRSAPAAALARLERICALPLPAPGVDKSARIGSGRASCSPARSGRTGRNPERARRLAAQSRDGYAARGARFAEEQAAAEKWRASNLRAAMNLHLRSLGGGVRSARSRPWSGFKSRAVDSAPDPL